MTTAEAQRYVLDRAGARGVAAEVLSQRGRELTLRAYEGRLEHITDATQGGIGLRVVVDGRVGYGYTEELTADAIDWMLEEAIENAALQDETKGFLPPGRELGTLDLVGDSLSASQEAKAQAALGFEATLREDGRVSHVVRAAYAEREWEVAVGSTEGAAGSYRRGVAGMMASVVMQDGNSRKQGYGKDWVTSLQALDPGRTALTLTERTGRLLGAKPLPTGRYPAYFEPKAFATLLAAFWPMWSGKAAMEGKSRLWRRLGERIGASGVTLVDDPTLPEGLASRPFDAEGTPTAPVTLMEDGTLRAFLTNSETARALDLPNTGHAARPYRGAMTVAPSNLFVRASEDVALEGGVVVTEVMGAHAGASAITGKFSLQAFGLWVEGGDVAYPVENFAVAGDFLTLLSAITGLGKSLEWESWGSVAFGAPLVAVAELSFAGI